MIQRIQSVYLFLAAVACLACLCMQIGSYQVADGTTMREFNLWILQADGTRNFISSPLFIILIPTVFLCVYTIFIYSNRKLQARFAMFAILMLVGWYVVYAVLMLTLPAIEFHLEWPVFLPFAAIVLCIMARRGIKHDEQLVRAADRIR